MNEVNALDRVFVYETCQISVRNTERNGKKLKARYGRASQCTLIFAKKVPFMIKCLWPIMFLGTNIPCLKEIRNARVQRFRYTERAKAMC